CPVPKPTLAELRFYANGARRRAKKDWISSRAAMVPSRSKIAPEITKTPRRSCCRRRRPRPRARRRPARRRRPSARPWWPVLRLNSVRRQVIDLPELIRRRSRRNGHSPAPPASTPPDALRRPPSGRPGEPCFAPPARRLQEDGEPAEVAQQRSAVLGRVVQGVDRL